MSLISFGGKNIFFANHQFQNKHECRGDVFRNQILWNLTCGSSPRGPKLLLHDLCNDAGEKPPKMFMEVRPSPGSNPVASRMPMLIVVLEDRKAEPKDSLFRFARSR